MNVPWQNQTEEWRGELKRTIEEFHRRRPELFDHTEEPICIPNSNGLGVWIGVKSVHARNRLESVHRLVFSRFAPEARYTDNAGLEWVHFGYFHPSARPEKIGPGVRFVDAA
jgi:hypothetical protein